MKELRLKLHSVVDLITNSSTVLYTDSSKSLEALENVIKEMFKLYDIDKQVEEVFDIYIEIEDMYSKIHDYIVDNNDEFDLDYDDENFYGQVDKLAKKYFEDVESNKIDRMNWTSKFIDNDISDNNWIIIKSKDKKYENLADLLKKLIYSTEMKEGWE